MSNSYNLKSFGNNIKINSNIEFLKRNRNNSLQNLKITNSITRGKGSSYGDSSINKSKTFLSENLNRIIFFDKKKGIISCEAGITISSILKLIVNEGWFLPVTPGSKKISLGGMIASNVHGKNQHSEGCFHNFISSIELLYKNKKILYCTKKNNKEIFDYTIGGMGLTGIILSATFKLKKIKSNKITQVTKVLNGIDKIIYDMSNNKSEYAVSWIDFNNQNNRGIVYYGNHSKKKNNLEYLENSKKFFRINNLFLNNLTIRIFNKLYFYLNLILNDKKRKEINLNQFFYPLDKIDNWNLMYGNNGFFQYQFTLPFKNWKKALTEIKKKFKEHNVIAYLCVMKLMKNEKKLMSFSEEGLNFAIDFKNNSNAKLLMNELDKILIRYKGFVYLAKDSRLNSKNAKKLVKHYELFRKFRKKNNLDKIFISMQSKRIGL